MINVMLKLALDVITQFSPGPQGHLTDKTDWGGGGILFLKAENLKYFLLHSDLFIFYN